MHEIERHRMHIDFAAEEMTSIALCDTDKEPKRTELLDKAREYRKAVDAWLRAKGAIR